LDKVETETVKKPSSNRSAKDRRNTLFRVLDGVLSFSHRKIHGAGNSDKAKQGWARVMVSAVSTYGSLLKDVKVEFRVIALEEKLKNSILNFTAELYVFQTKMPFYLVTSNPQLIKGNLDHWKIKRVGHGSHGREDTRINTEIRSSLSRQRITVSLQYFLKKKKEV
jgi:hypothetical protein